MLKKILIPLDGSLIAEKGLELARKWLDPNGELILLRVAEFKEILEKPLTPFDTYHLAIDTEKGVMEAAEYLIGLKKRLERDGYHVTVITEPPTSEVAARIVAVAEAEAVDAITMTTNGLSGIRRFILGSNTLEVLKRATVPVIVQPPPFFMNTNKAADLLVNVAAPVI